MFDLARTILGQVNNCSDHTSDIREDEIADVVGAWNNGDDESESVALVVLRGGGYAVLEESADYTGHG